MLGVKSDNRESVHGPKKVALTPNIGLDVLQQYVFDLVFFESNAKADKRTPKPAQAGQENVVDEK